MDNRSTLIYVELHDSVLSNFQLPELNLNKKNFHQIGFLTIANSSQYIKEPDKGLPTIRNL